ncbi:MAG: hypothetical protein H7255_03425 [Ramlibacter sp.]|nr:hypothetical protein [Ramlibacter sp.]
MKKLIIIIAMAILNAAVSVSAATLPNQTLNVNITLTSKCEVVTSPADIPLTYTSFQTTAASNTATYVFRCTNTLPISAIALDATAGGGLGGATIVDAATNLNYTVALTGVPTAGNGASQTVTITANIPANQAGTCATATCTNAASGNKLRTITFTY